MALLTGDARYSDLIERTLFNGFLAGVSLDGQTWLYVNPLHVRVVMPMRAFGDASPGMSATIVPEILQNQHYAAKVTGVDRIIDAASGTFVVFIDLPNPKFDLPSGVKCKATLNK